jgi:hypothetical protein
MEQVQSVYERAYDEAYPVVCLDESPKQVVSETRIGFTDSKGITHLDYAYKREGVAQVYMLVEPLRGYRNVLVEDNHKSATYAHLLAHLVEELYATAQKITLIEDNLSAHPLAALYEEFPAPRARNIIERLEIVRTPAHGAWLNIAESELSVLKRQGLQQRTPSKEELEKQVREWYGKPNGKKTKVDWQFTTKDARIKLRHLYPSTNS